MDDFFRHPLVRFFAVAIGQAIVGAVAIATLSAVAQSDDAKDIGVIFIWGLLIVGGVLVLIFAPWQSDSTVKRAEIEEIVKELAPKVVQPSPPPPTARAAPVPEPPTGETLVSNVAKGIDIFHAELIDYHVSSVVGTSPYSNPKNLFSLRLGEIALLRRLAVAKGETQDRYRCEQVLDAAGVKKPGGSIVRLHDMELLQQSDGIVKLTALGREFSWIFSMCLTNSLELVHAYRQITPQINNTVRFDGKSITGR
jgi:hypothetical protein